MGYDPRSAAVIGLCIGAILLAAVLFPAAGIDGAPASTDGETTGTPAGDGSVVDGTDGSSEADGTDGDSNADDGSDGSGDDPNADPGSDDPSTGDDDTRDDGSTEPGADEQEPAPGGTALIDRLPQAIAVGMLTAVLLLGSGYAFATGKVADWTVGPDGGTDPLPDGPLPRLRVRLARIPQVTMVATIVVARQATAAGTAFATLGRTVARAGSSAGTGMRTALRSVTTLSIGLPSIPRLALPAIGWSRGSADGTDGSRTGAESLEFAGAASAAEDEGYTEPETVEDAWRRLVASLAVRRPSVRTPRECAAVAVDAGLPREAVETLTATFEAVRYGGATRTPARLERVREAYARVREARRGDGR